MTSFKSLEIRIAYKTITGHSSITTYGIENGSARASVLDAARDLAVLSHLGGYTAAFNERIGQTFDRLKEAGEHGFR